MNELKWIKFKDEMPGMDRSIYISDYENVFVCDEHYLTYTENENELDQFLICYDVWAYVPMPHVPKKEPEHQRCDYCFAYPKFKPLGDGYHDEKHQPKVGESISPDKSNEIDLMARECVQQALKEADEAPLKEDHVGCFLGDVKRCLWENDIMRKRIDELEIHQKYDKKILSNQLRAIHHILGKLETKINELEKENDSNSPYIKNIALKSSEALAKLEGHLDRIEELEAHYRRLNTESYEHLERLNEFQKDLAAINPQAEPRKPKIGNIVLFNYFENLDISFPAIIINIHENNHVSLRFFGFDFDTSGFCSHAPYSKEPKAGHWSWRE